MHLRIATVMRVLGFVLGGCCALFAAMVLLAWASFDAPHASASIAQYFRDQYQRNLRLGEAPRLRMRPFPVLELHQLSLSEPGKNTIFASADTVRINLQLIPLLLRQPVVERIAIQKLNLQLERGTDQSWNLDDLLAGGQGLQDAPWQMRLQQVDIADSQITIADKASGGHLAMDSVNLHTTALQNGIPGSLQARGTLHTNKADENVSLKLEAHYTLREQLRAGHLSKLHAQFDGDALGLKGASCNIEGGDLIWSEGGTRLSLNDGTLRLKGALGEQALDFSSELATLGRDGFGLQGKDWEANFVVRKLDRETRFHVEIPALNKTDTGFLAPKLQSKIEQRIGKQSLTLNSDGPLGVDFKQNSLSLAATHSTLDLHWPSLQNGAANLTLTSQLNWHGATDKTPALTTANLVFAHNKDNLSLNAQLQQLWPLQGSLDISSPRLDLNQLFTREGLSDAIASNLPLISDATLSGRLNLAQWRGAGIRSSSIKSSWGLAQGKLSLSGLQADAYGGKFTSEFNADLDNGQFSLSGEFNQLALAPLAKDLAIRLPLNGQLSGSHALTGSCKHGQSTLESLQGAIRWKLQDGSLQGVDIARSLREFRPAIHAAKPTARTPAANEATPIGIASSRFVFDNGKLIAESMVASNDWLNLAGSGSADLKNNEIDFAFKTDILPKAALGATRDLLDLRGKAIPLRLKGKPVGPDVRYEPALKLAAAPQPVPPAAKKAAK